MAWKYHGEKLQHCGLMHYLDSTIVHVEGNIEVHDIPESAHE